MAEVNDAVAAQQMAEVMNLLEVESSNAPGIAEPDITALRELSTYNSLFLTPFTLIENLLPII